MVPDSPSHTDDFAAAGPAALASRPHTVLTLGELAACLRCAQPPAAYRLSLDSGVEYKNVRRALERPESVRRETWRKIVRSLGVHMLAATRPEDLRTPGDRTRVVGFGAESAALVPATAATSLRACRQHRGWSGREMAARAGISIEAVRSVERGSGLVGNLLRICAALDLQLLFALPSVYPSIEALWRERAARCLEEPAQYPVRSARRSARRVQMSASIASAAAIDCSSARFTESASTANAWLAASCTAAWSDSMDRTSSRKGA